MTYERCIRQAVEYGARREWLSAGVAAAQALAARPNDPAARRLLAAIERGLTATDPAGAAGLSELLRIAPRMPAAPSGVQEKLGPNGGFSGQSALRLPSVIYVNALLCALLALVVFAAGGASGGTWAYFTGLLPVSDNTLATDTVQPPTNVSAVQNGSAIDVTWTASSTSYVTGYDVYQSTTSGSGYVLAGSVAAGVTSLSFTPTPDDATTWNVTYYFVVRAKTGTAWVSGVSNEASAARVDTTAPAVSQTSPNDTATGVPLTSTITLTFSEAVSASTVQGAFSASPAITCSWSPSTGNSETHTCTPSASLIPDTGYTITLGTGVADRAGNTMAAAHQFRFTTFATTGAPQVTGVNPYNGATGVGTNSSITVTFSQTMSQSSVQSAFSLRQTSGSGSPCYVTGDAPLCPAHGGSFSWSANNTVTFVPSNTLAASAAYAVAVSTAAQNTAGTALAEAFNASFTTAAGADTTAPQVVPPTSPEGGATGVAINTGVTITFSEGMNNTATQSAFALAPCSPNDSVCSAAGAPVSGGFAWTGAGNNILTFKPASNLASNQWYRVTIGTGAQDLAGNAMASPYSFVFQTSSSAGTAPPAPAVNLPAAEDWTTNSTYTISGTAAADSLIEVWSDGGTRGTIDGTDTVRASLQLNGGLTSWSVTVTLTSATTNLFQVTARNSAGLRSTSTIVPAIHQGDVTTTTGSLILSPGSDNLTVVVGFSGDANASNSATVRWRTPATTGTYGSAVAMARGTEQFTYTITGLTASTTYEVEVTISDGDGVSGVNPLTSTATTTSGGQTGLLGNSSASANFASRAPQSVSLAVSLQSGAKSSNVTINTSPAKALPCNNTDGPATVSFTWDGTDGSGNPVADGSYTYTVAAYTGNNCPGGTGSQQRGGNLVVVSNVRSITMSPPPAAVTLSQAGQSVCVTATLVNRRDELVPDGVPVTFSFSASPSGGSYTLTQPATGKTGSAAAGCATPASGSGQAVAKLTVNTPYPSTITVTATASTQLSGTILTTVSGSTTINDPPDAPSGLELLPGSIRVRFRPSLRATAAGYYVLIGTAPGQYNRRIDIGKAAAAHIREGIVPGQRYYVAVQAYDALGQTSPLSEEASILLPPGPSVTPSVTATITATSSPAPAGASATSTPAGTPAASETATATPAPTAIATHGETPAAAASASASASAVRTISQTPTPTATSSATPAGALTPTATVTVVPTAAATVTATSSATPAGALTPTATVTVVPTAAATVTATPPATAAVATTATVTATAIVPSHTPTSGSGVSAPTTTPSAATTPTGATTRTPVPATTPPPTGTVAAPPTMAPARLATATP